MRTASQMDYHAGCVLKIHPSDRQKHIIAVNDGAARSIGDAGWGILLGQLVQKGETYGRQVILVPPEYTTQTCSACGHVMTGKEKLPLSAREWDCPACGTHHVRDTNAAKNILARALRSL